MTTPTTGQTTPTPVQTAPPRQQVGFFQEDNGNKSSMRLMSFTALIAGIVFALLTILRASDEGIYITFGFLIAAFAPKALQKFAETKLPPGTR